MAGNIREADDLRAVRKRVSKARNFPTNTCPWSRHAQLIGEAMAKGREWGGEEDRKHCGESILTTVASLYEARTKIEALEAERDAAREDLRQTTESWNAVQRCAPAMRRSRRLAVEARNAASERDDVDLCEVARELERVHVADVICKVASLNGGRTSPYWCGFALACEEIATRLGLTVDDVTRALEQEVP